MKILYICTHNRCRSILSEAITRQLSKGKLQAYSAGSQPAGKVHPFSLKYLAERGYSTEGLKSQSWDDFKAEDIDLVITVCDSAAKETCPLWFDKSQQIHWALSDPSKCEGSESELREAFFKTINNIESRVETLLNLDYDNLDKEALTIKLKKLIREAN